MSFSSTTFNNPTTYQTSHASTNQDGLCQGCDSPFPKTPIAPHCVACCPARTPGGCCVTVTEDLRVGSIHGWGDHGDTSGWIGQQPSEPEPVPSLASSALESKSEVAESAAPEFESRSCRASAAPESGSGSSPTDAAPESVRFSLANAEPEPIMDLDAALKLIKETWRWRTLLSGENLADTVAVIKRVGSKLKADKDLPGIVALINAVLPTLRAARHAHRMGRDRLRSAPKGPSGAKLPRVFDMTLIEAAVDRLTGVEDPFQNPCHSAEEWLGIILKAAATLPALEQALREASTDACIERRG